MDFFFNNFYFFGVIAIDKTTIFSGYIRVFISSSLNIKVVGTYVVASKVLPNFGVFMTER